MYHTSMYIYWFIIFFSFFLTFFTGSTSCFSWLILVLKISPPPRSVQNINSPRVYFLLYRLIWSKENDLCPYSDFYVIWTSFDSNLVASPVCRGRSWGVVLCVILWGSAYCISQITMGARIFGKLFWFNLFSVELVCVGLSGMWRERHYKVQIEC